MPNSHRERLWGGALLVNLVVGFLPPLILGAAIGWPASLGLPASEQLALVLPHLEAMRWGYGFYLLYSLAFFPLLVAVASLGPGASTRWLVLVAGFAALSTLCRAVGILRWLVPVPVLARLEDPTGLVAFEALNSYGGGIGEILGVGLFAGLALVVLGARWLGTRRWLGVFTIGVGAVHLVSVAEAFGADLGPFVTVVALSLLAWFLVVGVVLLRKGDQWAASGSGVRS